MTKELDDLREQLDRVRGRLDQLRLQANLGKMELRDKLTEIGENLDPTYREAKRVLGGLAESGATEARNFARSLLAGWDEVRRTHRELSRESED